MASKQEGPWHIAALVAGILILFIGAAVLGTYILTHPKPDTQTIYVEGGSYEKDI